MKKYTILWFNYLSTVFNTLKINFDKNILDLSIKLIDCEELIQTKSRKSICEDFFISSQGTTLCDNFKNV